MLVLTRRLNESIVIPALGITVRVLAVRGGRARLGVEAPREVAVLRGELHGPPAPRPAPSLA
jgi:carbon storage regulator CsrA